MERIQWTPLEHRITTSQPQTGRDVHCFCLSSPSHLYLNLQKLTELKIIDDRSSVPLFLGSLFLKGKQTHTSAFRVCFFVS